jgi:hypothetical protein
MDLSYQEFLEVLIEIDGKLNNPSNFLNSNNFTIPETVNSLIISIFCEKKETKNNEKEFWKKSIKLLRDYKTEFNKDGYVKFMKYN